MAQRCYLIKGKNCVCFLFLFFYYYYSFIWRLGILHYFIAHNAKHWKCTFSSENNFSIFFYSFWKREFHSFALTVLFYLCKFLLIICYKILKTCSLFECVYFTMSIITMWIAQLLLFLMSQESKSQWNEKLFEYLNNNIIANGFICLQEMHSCINIVIRNKPLFLRGLLFAID